MVLLNGASRRAKCRARRRDRAGQRSKYRFWTCSFGENPPSWDCGHTSHHGRDLGEAADAAKQRLWARSDGCKRRCDRGAGRGVVSPRLAGVGAQDRAGEEAAGEALASRSRTRSHNGGGGGVAVPGRRHIGQASFPQWRSLLDFEGDVEVHAAHEAVGWCWGAGLGVRAAQNLNASAASDRVCNRMAPGYVTAQVVFLADCSR